MLLPLLSLFLSTPLYAEDKKKTLEEEINEIFAEHVEAIKESDFDRVSKQVHPEEAAEHKEKFLKLANLALDHGEFGKFARIPLGQFHQADRADRAKHDPIQIDVFHCRRRYWLPACNEARQDHTAWTRR